jgi:3'-phosphoadenosine 5'-phosphosulfate sulfotransferase (PAPS reductase)/FAD synthetase
LEKEIRRCTRCVIPTSLPSVKTDREGVCQFCRRIDGVLNWSKVRAAKTQAEFEHIVKKVKARAKPYDCLIPLSGGKDSTYVLYLCGRIYDLKRLCVTFDNGYLSEHAKNNFENAINATRADHIFYNANPNVLHEL